MQEHRNMSLLEDGLRSEQQLQQQLQALKEAHRQLLQETERRQKKDLERRIHQNSLLSTDMDRESNTERKLDVFFNQQNRYVGPRRSSSTSALTSDKGTSQQVRQSERPASSSPAWVSSTAVSQHSIRTSKAAHKESQQLQQQALTNTQPVHLSKEQESVAECQKKFRAVPVPNHVALPLYHQMMRTREKERKLGHEQRKNFLLSSQKPFSFLEREEEKREKLMELLSQVALTQKTKAAVVQKPIPKEVRDPAASEHLREEELCRKVHIQTRAQEILRNSSAPIENPTHTSSLEPSCVQRTKKEMLAFLDEKPTFQPKINPQVPDFSRLHKDSQAEALQRAKRKDVTKCRPFHLRTSTLPARKCGMSPETSQEPTVSNRLKRSNSFGGLTSLSTDTLPTYITDAARKRCMAIRKSMELMDSKEQESAEWMKRYQIRSQAMKKTVAIRAKVMDPHSSLKEVYQEKLRQHREADQQRTRQYKRDLHNMKARVTVRPYLFEQVKQRNAKAHAEQTYRNKLREAGLNELFVEANGEGVEVTPATSRSHSDKDEDDYSTDNDMQSRKENVDDGEKIEEKEEKSVKSKG